MLFGGCVRGLEVGQVHARVRLWRYRVLVRDDAWVSVSHATHSAPHSAPHRTLSHQPSKTLTSRSTRKARVAASTRRSVPCQPPTRHRLGEVYPRREHEAVARQHHTPTRRVTWDDLRYATQWICEQWLPVKITHRHVASRGRACTVQCGGNVSSRCMPVGTTLADASSHTGGGAATQ
jgi:hypothetical protein